MVRGFIALEGKERKECSIRDLRGGGADVVGARGERCLSRLGHDDGACGNDGGEQSDNSGLG